MRSRFLLTVRSIRNSGIFCWLVCFRSSLTALSLEPREKQRETPNRDFPVFWQQLGHANTPFDLSRSRGEGDENLARLNMPLELGMAAAFRFERENSDRPHRWLALVPEGYAYQTFVSDLAGFDPARHDGTVSSIIREVSAWLRTQDDVLDPVPSAKNILQSFPSFRNELANLRIEALEKETWADVLLAVSKSVPVLSGRADLEVSNRWVLMSADVWQTESVPLWI